MLTITMFTDTALPFPVLGISQIVEVNSITLIYGRCRITKPRETVIIGKVKT